MSLPAEDSQELVGMALQQPKKPACGAFGSFMNAKRADFAEQNPGKPTKVVFKLAGEVWQKLPQEEKAQYQKTFEDTHAKYVTELAAFIAAGGVKAKGPQALRKQRMKAKAHSKHGKEIMVLAKEENLHNQLQTLMVHLDIRVVFKALQDAQGSINGAKRILLASGSEKGFPDIAPKKAMKTEGASESGDSDAEPPQKIAKIAKALGPEDEVAMIAKIAKTAKIALSPEVEVAMAQARKEKLHGKLQKLLENPKVAEKQFDPSFVFTALQAAKGSIVVAKRALLGP